MMQAPKSWKIKAQKEIKRIQNSITSAQKQELLKGMLLTRACDNALKHMFLSGDMMYQGTSFQGKGFRSLGQEAIYGAPFLLRIGRSFLDNDTYTGDIAAPLIRDLGVFLAMSDGDIEGALNAQAGKSGNPCDGRDFHGGDFSKGILIPNAPLAIATCTLIGLALSYKLKKQPRVALSFIGEGGSSLGEWHEAINFAAVNELAMVFCIENNQTALSTPCHQQSRASSFADKGIGYGINALSLDGNNIEEVAAGFSFAAEHARSESFPVLIELTSMRMCGHAHHDDMLYLGYDPVLDFGIPPLKKGGYADAALYEAWRSRDPIKTYQQKLMDEGVISEHDVKILKEEILHRVDQARNAIKNRSWPTLQGSDQNLVFKSPWVFTKQQPNVMPTFTPKGISYLHALALGIKECFAQHKNCIVLGEDVAPPYGNAFMLFRPIMDQFSDRFMNTPISENAIVGACVGMAMGGMLPIGELQFNDFIACSMNQVANNAAKCFFRTAINLPLVLRLPYGGLRRAGPFHSQDTSPWFFRTPGLKIMAPSTPRDAFLMIQKALNDPDPVLFYEHIALYRNPKIKQELTLGDNDGAQFLHNGDDITLISYGAYVYIVKEAASHLKERHAVQADVIDLRYLSPIDFETIASSVKKTGKVLLVGEDSSQGSILESIACRIGTELFLYLDAPVLVKGSRNIPVPYAPSLEDEYLVGTKQIIKTALDLIAF